MMINRLIEQIHSTPNFKENTKPYGFLKLRKAYPTVTGVRTNSKETIYSCSCTTANPVFKAQPLKNIFRDVFKKNLKPDEK